MHSKTWFVIVFVTRVQWNICCYFLVVALNIRTGTKIVKPYWIILLVYSRMEQLNIGSSISQIKVTGTVLSISGALLVTLYKGIPITSFRIQHSPSKPLSSLLAQTSNWAIGGAFFATASVSLALWNITQVRSRPSLVRYLHH